jgi:hypothetical protein
MLMIRQSGSVLVSYEAKGTTELVEVIDKEQMAGPGTRPDRVEPRLAT